MPESFVNISISTPSISLISNSNLCVNNFLVASPNSEELIWPVIGVQENTQDGYFVGIEIKEVIVTSISMSTPLIWCEEHFEQ